jgi:hypothetical protein
MARSEGTQPPRQLGELIREFLPTAPLDAHGQGPDAHDQGPDAPDQGPDAHDQGLSMNI